MQPGDELLATHWFHHVVVGAVLECKHDVLLGVAHGDEENGDGLGHIAAQPAQDFSTRDVGYLPVEHEEVEALATRLAHGFAARQPAMHIVPVRSYPTLEQGQL